MNSDKKILHAYVASHILEDDGTFPNSKFPVLVYKGALNLHPDDDEAAITDVFNENGWSNSWVDGVYDYHHYHSNTHEVLGILCGTADLQMGGDEGICVELTRGDVIVIPAGVAHKKLKGSGDFACVGAYPDGKDYDINIGKEGERPGTDENISKVEIPSKDPVYGNGGSLKECWV